MFITGEGAENGTTIAQAIPFKLVGNGEYEIFTKLEAGKNISLQIVNRQMVVYSIPKIKPR
ncbi:hypothetical protein KUH03_08890 [Sphingobacterium sp. E70]|uniref:hypothetical protein n=1 Tax=Sphingobacterium sp. E70 TaxID=2853439 RepID=UPI00211BA5E6|nr:hypothetical protein [Sphingobacterium sp. E70]ULT26920.1 hypothetical protein KUH03_08890 [Sphingobacterium sp. E70]